MKIGFISSKQDNSILYLSGAPFYMEKALEKYCGQVFFLQPSKTLKVTAFFHRVINKSSRTITGKRFATGHSLLTAYCAGRHFSKKIHKLNIDIIFATRASTQIALIKKKVPIIYTTDATFKSMENYYDNWTNLNKISVISGNFIEQRAISNSDRIFCPSAWAANSVIEDYKTQRNKVSIIQSGANFDDSDISATEQIFIEKDLSRCRLLFIGVDWQRKGGEIAFDTLNHLLAANIPAQLTIVGCEPPKKFLHEKVTVIKKLRKSIAEEKKKLITLYKQSNFFLLPARAEASGLVFSEAAAFGLPVITTDTGGITSIVRQGINGYTLSPSATAISYAKLIEKIFNDPTQYKNLARAARQEYNETLNWDTWASKVKLLMDSISS